MARHHSSPGIASASHPPVGARSPNAGLRRAPRRAPPHRYKRTSVSRIRMGISSAVAQEVSSYEKYDATPLSSGFAGPRLFERQGLVEEVGQAN